MPGSAFRPSIWNWRNLNPGTGSGSIVTTGTSYLDFWQTTFAARSGGGTPTPPPSGGGGGTPLSSVTQNGVTFTFDTTYNCGQFVNGDWWVVPPATGGSVTISTITPSVTGSGATLQNGFMVNPIGEAHCYDGRATSAFSAVLLPTLPLTLTPGSGGKKSVIKSVSSTSIIGAGANASYMTKCVVLTVLDTEPSTTDTFRPPYFGTVNRTFTQSQLLLDPLDPSKPGNLTVVAPSGSSGPSLANIELSYIQPKIDHCWNVATSGRPAPLGSFHAYGLPNTLHNYGENISIDNSEAILRMCLNDSIASKLNSIIYLVQYGIDNYGIAKGGVNIAGSSGGGGHYGGRKIITCFAAWLLNDTDMKSIAGGTTGGNFGEVTQFYFSTAAGAGSSHFTGAPVGMALFGIPNTFSKPFPYAESGGKDIRDSPQQLVDGGLSLNFALTTAQGANKDLRFTAAKRGLTGNITITYANTGTLSVSVASNAITVNINQGVTTASQIQTAVQGNVSAAALVSTGLAPGSTGAGTPTAFAATALSPSDSGAVAAYGGALYNGIASTHAILVSTICGKLPALRAIFNYDNEIFYADRLWDFGIWAVPDGSPGRDLGTATRALHGTAIHGAAISAGYGSAFGNAMRNTYFTSSTFTG